MHEIGFIFIDILALCLLAQLALKAVDKIQPDDCDEIHIG